VAALTTTAPIKQALVRWLRGTTNWGTVVVGGLHQSVAPTKTKYPFVTYNFVPSTRDYQWDGMQIDVPVDIFAFAENPVDAENIDSLIAARLQDAQITVNGQVLMYCRRIADVSLLQDDARGRRIYQIGGSYRLITDQHI
jgi:hypothetical protein